MGSNNAVRWLVWGGLGLVLLACLLPFFMLPIQIGFGLAFGWVGYISRVVPEVEVSPSGMASAMVCLALFTAGLHGFLSWLYSEIGGAEAGHWRKRWTGSLVAGVMLMFVAGMAATGVVHQVGWLLRSGERWVNRGSGQAARRAQSINNLKQIGLAAANYEQADGAFPPGLTLGEHGEMLHSWQTLSLRFMDHAETYNAVNFQRPWDDPANSTGLRTRLNVYLNPGFPGPGNAPALAPSHYEGNVRVLGGTRRFRVADVTGGLSNTIFAGESSGGFQPWGKPGHWRDPADGINRRPARGFGSPYPGGANVVFMDGSVKFLYDSTDQRLLKTLSTPDENEAVPPDSY